MIEHILEYVALFLENPAMIIASIASILLSFGLLYLARNPKLSAGRRVFLIYTHLTLLITPFALLAYTVGCEVPLYDCGAKTVIYAAPLVFIGIAALGTLAGFFAAPLLYARLFRARLLGGRLQRFVDKAASLHSTRKPVLYLLDTGKLVAFSVSSLKPRIFVSIGMLESLTSKELEAVLLHELGHINHRSSWLKVSTNLARFLSPVARFADFANEEEKEADAFAVRIQGTDTFVVSAHKKVDGIIF